MAGKITKIKSLNIARFRGLNDVVVNFGERITVICGKNGTSKSTILGIVAQMFNFETDYTVQPATDLKQFRTIANSPFSSQFREHFRLSSKYDTPSSMDVTVKIYDGAEKKDLDDLKLGLYLRSNHTSSRATVRNNTTTNGASDSRKVTHPLIYLSMKRLTPIPDRQKYTVHSINAYMQSHKREFIELSSFILGGRGSINLTQTKGTINSLVASGSNYDHQSVSVGEDNLGQILQAIFSFKQLQHEYEDYHGGIILIDEIDAGLFPAAQRRLMEKLTKIAKQLNLQFIFTTHSPEIINTVYDYSNLDEKLYKVNYLTNTFGKLEIKENFSWSDIKLDLYNQTLVASGEKIESKINVFFEDKENYDFFRALVTRRDLNKMFKLQKDITLGCENYIQLLNKKVPGFYKSAIIVLDGDVKKTSHENIVLLPTSLPPDQLIFEFLYNLEANDAFWHNDFKYTKQYFYEVSHDICALLELDDCVIDLKEHLKSINVKNLDGGRVRELFKNFVTEAGFRALVESGGVKYNPYRCWCVANEVESDKFNSKLVDALRNIIGNEFGVGLETVKEMVSK